MIKVLAPEVVSRIAAGEVVERPASVVKELVENSLDAGATQISVEIKGGGINLIRVTDNGQGIPGNQIELAFERHATSKISNFQDLQSLATLGFRGEALPSIAAVARVQIVSCARGETAGSYLRLEDGRVVRREPQARAPGTTITVEDLFRKIPARLKFLKSETTEAGRIADIVTRYALAYPEVRFTLTTDGRTSLRTPGNGDLRDSFSAIFGLELCQEMLKIKTQPEELEGDKVPIVITGLLGTPKAARSTRDYLSFFVNRRWVNHRMLSFAVEEAYHGLLMQGKHPIAVINLTLPPDKIDVNVHPSKTEIKFQDERAVFGAVQKTVRRTLVQSAPVPGIEEARLPFQVPASPLTVTGPPSTARTPDRSSERPETAPTPLISLPLLRVLGQLSRNYIVAEGPDGLYLIDQHAAHERIQFEKLRSQREALKVEVQGLLEPALFEAEPRQALTLKEHLAELNDYGFNIEPFGEKTFLVRSVPALLRDRDWKAAIRAALDGSRDNWAENLVITLACHSAVRAGQVLSEMEMRELVRQLEKTALPNSCPHGRPAMIHLTLQKLEKEFGRS